MKDVSNRTLVILLAIALVITIGSTIISINKLNELGWELTGAATSTGTGQTNLTISSSTSLTVAATQMGFGTGGINSSCEFCWMDSNAINVSGYSNGTNTSTDNGLCCRLDGSTAFSGPGNNGFLIENTGNLNISVGYTCSGNCTHALFIGGARSPGHGGLEIKVTENSVALQTGESGGTDTAASCLGGGTLFRSIGWNITNASAYGGVLSGTEGQVAGTYVSLMRTGHWLCGNQTGFPLMSDNSKDAAVVDINITIPAAAPASGVRSSFTLTFNGTSSA